MYTTIKLPNDLVAKIDSYISRSDDGYTSRTDLIKTAVRSFFEKNGFVKGENEDGRDTKD